VKSGNLNFLEPSGPLQACNGSVPSLIYTTSKYLKHDFDVITYFFYEECETRWSKWWWHIVVVFLFSNPCSSVYFSPTILKLLANVCHQFNRLIVIIATIRRRRMRCHFINNNDFSRRYAHTNVHQLVEVTCVFFTFKNLTLCINAIAWRQTGLLV